MSPAQQVVEELRNARTAWLEQHGVPISMEFVRFANAIGEADDTIVRMLEALEAILRSAEDGRNIPEWLAERLDLEVIPAIKKARGGHEGAIE